MHPPRKLRIHGQLTPTRPCPVLRRDAPGKKEFSLKDAPTLNFFFDFQSYIESKSLYRPGQPRRFYKRCANLTRETNC